MDIGGGSVEFIIANADQIFWQQSFEIGAQRLKDKFHREDPITDDLLLELNNYLDSFLEPLTDALRTYKPNTLIGVSGTFDTLSDIFGMKEGKEHHISEAESYFDLDAFEPMREELTNKTLEERIDTPGLPAFRAEMIVVAMALIDWILGKHEFNNIRISKYALKEGILYSMIKKID